MKKRQLGKTGIRVSVLGFGGAEIGYEQASVRLVGHLLGSALDAGLNVIDTAECYGANEELIGKTVAHRRKDYSLLTKCGHAAGLSLLDWQPRVLEQSIERSLRRLRTEYLDAVQLPRCPEQTLRKGYAITILQRARDAGKTRYMGYSGDSGAALYAVQCGAFDLLQISLNIADQEALDVALPAAMRHGLGVIAKRPIAYSDWRPGWDLSGVVETAAADGSGLHISTRVVGVLSSGAWGEQVSDQHSTERSSLLCNNGTWASRDCACPRWDWAAWACLMRTVGVMIRNRSPRFTVHSNWA
jgi:diketogulonate reductase-like aldo/keto reductase